MCSLSPVMMKLSHEIHVTIQKPKQTKTLANIFKSQNNLAYHCNFNVNINQTQPVKPIWNSIRCWRIHSGFMFLTCMTDCAGTRNMPTDFVYTFYIIKNHSINLEKK